MSHAIWSVILVCAAARAQTVSLAELRPPDQRARSAQREGLKLSAAGDHARAAAALEKAVALDPTYALALGDLGGQYVLLGRYQEAITTLGRALAIAPAASWLHSNFALALIKSGRLAEAEQSARNAIHLNPGNMQAHYLLGCALVIENNRAEGIQELEAAAGEVPEAYRALAQTYQLDGQTDLARAEQYQYQVATEARSRKKTGAWQDALLPFGTRVK